MRFHRASNPYVGQVHLKVQNLACAVQFYREVVGFRALEQTDRSARLTADGEHALLILDQPDPVVPKPGRTTGLYHFALLLPTRADLAKFLRHITNYGIRCGASDHLVSEALYFSDPDGNGIEVYSDRDPRLWNWHGNTVEMTVDPLDFGDLLATLNDGSAWSGLPRDTVMGHIHLHVAELAKAERFYTDGLGFEVVHRFGSQALFVSTGRYHHHIGLNTWNGAGAPQPPKNSAGLTMYAIHFPNQSDLERALTNLRRLEAPLMAHNNGYITSDPSGNLVHLLAVP